MKHQSFPFGLIILATCLQGLQAQKLSLGAGSGINFSDIHTQVTSGSWKPKPGPSSGLFVRWSMTPSLGLQTGLNYSTVYYEHHNYVSDPGPIFYEMLSSSFVPYPDIYIATLQSSNHSFLTVPVEVTVTLPAKPSLTLGAGMFWSAVLDQDSDNGYYYEEIDAKNDYGYLFSLSLEYPVTDRFGLFTRGRYITGRKQVGSAWNSRHGYSELLAGFTLNLGNNTDPEAETAASVRQINEDIRLTWFAGVAVSWNSGNSVKDKYSLFTGPSAGFLVDIRSRDPGTWFRTGLILERAGYSLRDSSDLYYRYEITDDAAYLVDTRTSSDYAVIPALLGFRFGGKEAVSLGLGPWFAARLNTQCRGMAWREYESGSNFRRTEITVNDDITDYTRRNDFGLMFSADFMVPVHGNSVFRLGLNFRQGFPEVLHHERAGIRDENRPRQVFIRNSVVTLHGGLTVPVYRISK